MTFHEGIKSGWCLGGMHHGSLESYLVSFTVCVVQSYCYYSRQLSGFPRNQSESTQLNTFSTLLTRVRSPNYLGSVATSADGGQNNQNYLQMSYIIKLLYRKDSYCTDFMHFFIMHLSKTCVFPSV